MTEQKGNTCTEAQMRAVKLYQSQQKRLVIWYPTAVKEKIQRKVRKAKLTYKEIFEAGLKVHNI